MSDTYKLTDEQIDAASPAKLESQHWFTRGARWAEAAATAPLLARIAELERELAGVRNGITEKMIFMVGQATWIASGGDFDPTKDEVRAICRAAIDATIHHPRADQ